MTVLRFEPSDCTPTPVQLEAAIALMRTALHRFEQALWDGDNTRITHTRRDLSLAIKDARRVAAYSARVTPDLAIRIGAHDSQAPAEAR